MKRVLPARLHRAIINLSAWREAAPSQGAMHLFGLLALLEKGVTSSQMDVFEEEDDFAFWNKYLKVDGGSKPYFDPLTRQLRIESHPHSNIATARKGTFAASWRAAESEVGKDKKTRWRLSQDFVEVFRRKALTKGGDTARVPVVDLAALLFREDEFADAAAAKDLEKTFQQRFHIQGAAYDRLLEFKDEDAAGIFTSATPSPNEYRKAITDALISAQPKPKAPAQPSPKAEDPGSLNDDDPVLIQIKELVEIGTSGVILRGPPGTSKTWYAHQIARRLTADSAKHVFKVQFHPSLGYEDFVEGYRPDVKVPAGFSVVDKTFLEVCAVARATTSTVVLIIDEINRGDPARVLGELLTYVEHGYRNVPFRLPYTGKETTVPHNLLILGTMNPFDKSITQLDLALIRRFDHIDVNPSTETLTMFLERSGAFTDAQVALVTKWFTDMQRLLPMGLGHTYFKDVDRPEKLRLIWKYRIWPLCESMLELDFDKQGHVKQAFEAMYAKLTGAQPA